MRHLSRYSYLRLLGSLCAIFVLLASAFVTAHFSQARATSSLPVVNNPVIFLHGINDDCHAWKQAMDVLKNSAKINFTGPRIKLGYYTGDLKSGSNCTANLSESGTFWRNSCNGYLDGTAQAEIGTNNESIRHLACEFAWYIYFEYSNRQISVDVVAHSMGGLIARYALYAVQNSSNPLLNKSFKGFFPPQLLISNVIDFDTPNGGIFSSSYIINTILCAPYGTCRQSRQMAPDSDFISELHKNGQDPQGSGQGTTWSLFGSTEPRKGVSCLAGWRIAPPIFPDYSLDMNGSHIAIKVVYEQPYYCHNGPDSMLEKAAYPTDQTTVLFCNGCAKQNAKNWQQWKPSSTFPDPLYEMLHVLSAQASSPTPTPSPTLSLSPSPSPTLTSTVTSTPTPSPTSSVALNDVAAISTSDIWAVGTIWYGNEINPLIEHWDGNQWSVVPSPKLSYGQLASVAAISANDIWAVGYIDYTTLVEHWDGNQWSVISSPNSNAISLISVAAISTNDVWAVGCNTSSGYTPQVEHWDGSQWNLVSSPNPNGTSSCFNGMVAVSPNDIWATGFSNRATLIEHWDGSQWSIIPSPNSPINPNMSNRLTGVAAVSPNDIWAVGPTDGVSLIEHWDGSQWSVVNSPNGQNYTELLSVAAISANDIMAVGDTSFVSSNSVTYTPLIEQWNGNQWNIVPGPNFNMSVRINSVAVISSTDIWAVGSGSTTSAIAHWDGHQWSVVPGPV